MNFCPTFVPIIKRVQAARPSSIVWYVNTTVQPTVELSRAHTQTSATARRNAFFRNLSKGEWVSVSALTLWGSLLAGFLLHLLLDQWHWWYCEQSHTNSSQTEIIITITGEELYLRLHEGSPRKCETALYMLMWETLAQLRKQAKLSS